MPVDPAPPPNDPGPPPEEPGGNRLLRAVAIAGALPAACLAGGLWGAMLDRFLGLSPLLTVLGVLLGFAGAVVQLMRGGTKAS